MVQLLHANVSVKDTTNKSTMRELFLRDDCSFVCHDVAKMLHRSFR